MIRLAILFVFLFGASVSVEALTCRSGFHASIAGVPFYQWYQLTCAPNSECFGQEIIVTVQDLDVVVQYGGCVSSVYSNLISCESLFGQESTLDPAELLDVIPNLDQNMQLFISQFSNNVIANLKTLFSAGTDSEEFIAGLFKFYENLGFNIDKLGTLEAPLGKLFTAFFAGSAGQQQAADATNEIFDAISALDTTNAGITEDLYTFLETLDLPRSTIESTVYASLVEKLPGLLLSTLPASFEANRWYDEIFDLLSKLDIGNPRQSVENMIVIVKGTDWVPSEYKTYTDKFLDRLPELVEQLADGNASYPGYWSTLLLMDYSEETTATTELNNAITNFFTGLGVTNLPGELQMVFKYLPGHFYNYFPDNREDIDEVYGKIADGFNSFDFANLADTQPATNMSNFIIFLIDNVAPGVLNDTSRLFIINFSYTFRTLLEPDYNDELDTFFTTLLEGFQNYPTFDLGQIVQSLVVDLGGTVPTEVEPLLTNLQSVINTLVPTPDFELMVERMRDLIDEYKTSYPDSLFPTVFEDVIDLYTLILSSTTAPPQEQNAIQLQIQLHAQYINIDLQFALVQLMGYSSEEIESLLTSSFPAYGVLIKSIMVLQPADVRGLVKDIVTWMFDGLTANPVSLTSQGFVDAVKPTVEKITAGLGEVVSDFRAVFSPNSCKSLSCDTDGCNTAQQISNEPAVTKAPSDTSDPETTTSSSNRSSSFLALVILGVVAAIKAH